MRKIKYLVGFFFCFLFFLKGHGQVLLLNEELFLNSLEKVGSSINVKKLKGADANYQISKFDVLKKELGIEENDYFSLATYWWPNSYTKDGLPYIGKDGQPNPERLKVGDFENLKKLSKEIKTSVHYYLETKDTDCLKHIEKLVNTWFINSDSKMNPNLNFAQIIRGRDKFRIEGTIEGMYLMEIGYYLTFMERDLDQSIVNELKTWFNELLNWYLSDKVYKEVLKSTNNIGTAYFMQVLFYYKFSDNTSHQLKINEILRKELPKLSSLQFDTNGAQKFELRRTKKISYSVSNIMYWCNIITILKMYDDIETNKFSDKISLGLKYINNDDKLNKNLTNDIREYIKNISLLK